MTVEQGGFAATVAQAVETVVMQAEQRVYAGICRIAFHQIAVGIFTLVVIFRPQTADHHLQRTGEVVHGEDIVLHAVAGIIDVAEVTPVKGEITAQAVVPLHVVDTAAGTGEKHDVRVDPVNIKVVAVKTFPGPQGGAFKRPGERRQVTQFDKGLTNV